MILYHGTSKESSELILKDGFKEGSYFTEFMNTALVQGGEYIFCVYFESAPTKYWEYISPDPISKDRIIRLLSLSPEVVYANEDMEIKVIRDGIRTWRSDCGLSSPIFCETCKSRGALNYHGYLDRLRDADDLESCPTCNGHGVLNPHEEIRS